jgi:nucleoside-diphosphate-sugar epimerase
LSGDAAAGQRTAAVPGARILITGAGGCVGQYTAEHLYRHSNAELLLLLRDPSKLKAVPADDPRITLLVGDLRDLEPHAAAIATATRVIHTATAWGDPQRAQQVNVVAVKRLLALLDPARLEQVIYFSTASILDRNLNLLPEAMAYGTEYIQTKAQCLQDLERHPLAERIVAVFPTLVFGGRVGPGDCHPTSYLTAGVKEGLSWLWLAKWLRTEASFHFIHAADIATVCAHLATTPQRPNPEPGQGAVRRLVLGQAPITINQFVASLVRWRRGWLPPVGIDLQGWLIEGLIKLLRIEVNAWDRFSIRQRHFVHQPVSPPERFGLTSYAPTLEAVLDTAGVPRRGRLPD